MLETKEKLDKIGLGGGCHWCTEAVFQSLRGVHKVEQGYIASEGEHSSNSEAVIVYFNPAIIALATLVEIHLHTHKSTSNHSFREKYRSAIYFYSEAQKNKAKHILGHLQNDFENPLITKVLPFTSFTASRASLQNYYYDNPKKPFCERFINPKLQLLLQKFSVHVHEEKFI